MSTECDDLRTRNEDRNDKAHFLAIEWIVKGIHFSYFDPELDQRQLRFLEIRVEMVISTIPQRNKKSDSSCEEQGCMNTKYSISWGTKNHGQKHLNEVGNILKRAEMQIRTGQKIFCAAYNVCCYAEKSSTGHSEYPSHKQYCSCLDDGNRIGVILTC